MRKKFGNGILAIVMAVALSGMTAVSVQSAEFTDGLEIVEEAETEAAAFSDGGQAGEDGTVFEDGLEYLYISGTDSYKLVKGANRVNVSIPRRINGKMVTGIAENAFVDCTELRIVIVDGPVMVEKNAFVNCPRLQEFAVNCYPDKPKFAVGAFQRDSKVIVTALGGVHSPELNEYGILCFDDEDSDITYRAQFSLSYVRYRSNWYLQDYDDSSEEVLVEKFAHAIGRRALYGCSKLQEVRIANGPVSIGTKAFADCKNLRKVVIPPTVTDISSDAFEGADKVVIYAMKGSYALEYAKKNGIAYKVDDMRMPSPKLRGVRNGYKGGWIRLKWTRVPYAKGYQIYRRNRETGKYERIYTIKENDPFFYFDVEIRDRKTEHYKVRAYSDMGVYSEKYSPSSPRLTVEYIPDKVEIQTVHNHLANKLRIYWYKQEGADGYLLYRSETEPYRGYKKVEYITDESASKYTEKYTDTGVKKGKTYYYRIQAYVMNNGKRLYGKLSDPYKVKCK